MTEDKWTCIVPGIFPSRKEIVPDPEEEIYDPGNDLPGIEPDGCIYDPDEDEFEEEWE